MAGKSTEDIWWCGNGDGKHSAIITIKGVDEIESLYHLDVGGGKGYFYLTKTKKVVDYYNRDSFIMDLGVF